MPSPRRGGRGRRRTPAPVSASLGRLGDRIRAARQEAGLSQSRLGAGRFTRAYVSAVELGKIQPSMKSLEFLADRLRKPASFFLQDEEEERRRREREFTVLRAKDLIARGETGEAILVLEPLLREDQPPRDQAHLHRLLGRAHWTARDGRRAVTHLDRSVELLERVGNAREVQRARRDLAAALLEAGAADRALAIYRQLLESSESESPRDPVFRMAVLRGLGATYSIRGDSTAAVEYYEQALDLAQDVGDLSSLGRIYSGIAYNHWRSGDHEAALTNMRRAIAIHQDANDLGAVAEIHNNIAALCIEQKLFPKAREHVDAARRVSAGLGRPSIGVALTVTEADLALAEGDLEECTRLSELAMRLADQAGYERGRAAGLRTLARVASRQDRREDAVRLMSDAADGYARIDMPAVAADCLYEVSKRLLEWGDVARAQSFAARAYELARAGSQPGAP